MWGFRGFRGFPCSSVFSHQIATCSVFSRGHLPALRPWASGDHFRKVVDLTEILGITWINCRWQMEGIFRVYGMAMPVMPQEVQHHRWIPATGWRGLSCLIRCLLDENDTKLFLTAAVFELEND